MTTTPTTWLDTFLTNLETVDTQTQPQVIGLSNGNFLVVWADFNDTAASSPDADIVGVVFDALGNVVEPAKQLNTFGVSRSETDPVVGADGNGGFVLVYEIDDQGFGNEVVYDRYDSDVSSNGRGFIFNGTPGGIGARDPSIAVNEDGSFFVTYEVFDGDVDEVRGRTVSADNVVGTEYVLRDDGGSTNGVNTGNPTDPDTAVLSDGRYVTVYEETDDYTQNGTRMSDQSIEIRFSTVSGANFSVTNVTQPDGLTDSDPHVAALSGGEAVVVWTEDNNIWAKIYADYNSPVGSEFQIAATADLENEPDVIGLEDGGFFVVWDNDTDGTIEGQRYDENGLMVGTTVIVASDGNGLSDPNLGLTTDGRILVSSVYGGDVFTTILDPRESIIFAEEDDGATTGRQDTSTLFGTDFADTIFGVGGRDVILGWDGDDLIDAGNGDDIVNGGAGGDTMIGGAGNDTLSYSGSNSGVQVDLQSQTFAGGDAEGDSATGFENITGSAFDDVLTPYYFSDVVTVNGGGGSDTYDMSGVSTIGTISTDLEAGTTSYGVSLVSIENYIGSDSSSVELIYGSSADNVLRDGGGNSTIDGRGGADEMYGGTGDDIYVVDNVGDRVFEYAAEGTDDVYSSVSFSLRDHSQHIENLELTGTSDISGTGNGLANTITGNAGNNVLNGAWGDDTLIGGGGNDTFQDDIGADTMIGGTGDDTYYVDNVGDVLVENSGEGIDTVNSSISFALRDHSQHLETLTLTGTANTDGTGNGLANTITGNTGNNVLNGAWGDDTLIGGGGNDTFQDDIGADTMIGGTGDDTYYVDNVGDVLVENSGEGIDTVNSSISFALRDHSQHLENLTLTGTANTDGTGNERANTITGNSGNNVLNGAWGDDTLIGGGGNDTFQDGIGADTMIGGTGDDTYYVDNVGDVLVENSGEGIDTVNSSISFALRDHSQHLEHLTLTGSANIDGTGNERANTITGNSGDNVLDGAWGNDTLIGGTGDDTFKFVGTFGQDTVTDFDIAAANEVIDLSALSSITGFTDLENNHMSQVGADTVIDDGSGNTITLTGIAMTDLTADEFLFGAEPPSAVMSPFEAVNAKGIMNLRGNDKGFASIKTLSFYETDDAAMPSGIFMADVMAHEYMF